MTDPTIEFTEQFKEAILKAKGQAAAFIFLADGTKMSIEPTAFRIVEKTGDRVVLEPIRHDTKPSRRKLNLARRVMRRIREKAHDSLDEAVETALLEKSESQLEALARASVKPSARITRKFDCFWITTEDEEVLL